jgi:hypothetical protein
MIPADLFERWRKEELATRAGIEGHMARLLSRVRDNYNRDEDIEPAAIVFVTMDSFGHHLGAAIPVPIPLDTFPGPFVPLVRDLAVQCKAVGVAFVTASCRCPAHRSDRPLFVWGILEHLAIPDRATWVAPVARGSRYTAGDFTAIDRANASQLLKEEREIPMLFPRRHYS